MSSLFAEAGSCGRARELARIRVEKTKQAYFRIKDIIPPIDKPV